MIRYQDGQNEIYNEAGRQVHGSMAAGLEGLNPRELLEASLGLCVSLPLTALLERDGVPLGPGGMDIEVTASKAGGITNRFTDFKVSVDFPHLEPKYKEKAMTMTQTLYSGPNPIIYPFSASTTTIANWGAPTNGYVYIYLTQENHDITVNGTTTYSCVWNGDGFTVS